MVDALPYIDVGFDEAAKAAAMALVEEECRTYRPTKDYLAHLPAAKLDSFQTDAGRAEVERLAARQPMEMLSMKRYELPGPAPGRLNDVGAWAEAVGNSQAQLEHQRLRAVNLELMGDYGSEAWKAHLTTMEAMVGRASKELVELRRELQSINYERKAKQTEAGQYLKALEASWVGLVSKNYQIEQACAEMDAELAPLRKKFKPLLDAEKAALAGPDALLNPPSLHPDH